MLLPSSQPIVFTGSRWKALFPLLLCLPLLTLCFAIAVAAIYWTEKLGFRLNRAILFTWPLLVTFFVCLAFTGRAGAVFKPARFTISRFGVELVEGRRSFQLRWEEVGDPAFRAVRGRSVIVFGQSYSMGGMIDPMLPRIENIFTASLTKILSEIEKNSPGPGEIPSKSVDFGSRYPDNEAPIYVVPALFLILVAFAAGPVFFYWSSYY